ncbi:MAG: SCP2 sterol-binding domain-containing protein, partial [Desulfobacterales bacterium]|nr:SCP2 sterol-binding domain-containing protein [Desulfobacterales bacterium]
DKIRLKIKLVIYMITTALSQYNKAGDPDMKKWTGMQPDRIYQISCEPEGIAAYLRIKAGKSKAGRGYYTRKLPFVHMKLNTAENALPVFLNEVEFVEAISKGYVEVEGSPEYAAKMNDFMQRIQALIT